MSDTTPTPAHRPWLRRCMIGLLLAMLAGVFVCGAGLWWVQRTVQQPSAQAASVVIAPGTPFRSMVTQLHDAGVIAQPQAVWVYALLNGLQGKLQAGEYAFTSGETAAEVLDKLARGDVVVRQITIPEGWTSGQILRALAQAEGLEGALPATLPEASILPDTYRYQRGDTRAQVLARMQAALQTLLAQAWPQRSRATAVTTVQDALILASVVERETGVGSERAMVSAVYNNRVRLGMPLQADPTVIYGITLGQRDLGRPLSKADLRTPTPYNTYTQLGLPAGPICHPGRAAILATLNPASSDVLYFVANGQGTHRFANNLAEHNRNVALLRAHERQQNADALKKP